MKGEEWVGVNIDGIKALREPWRVLVLTNEEDRERIQKGSGWQTEAERFPDLSLRPREGAVHLCTEDLWIIETPLAALVQLSTYKKIPGNPLQIHVPKGQLESQATPLVECGAEVCSELTWLQNTEELQEGHR